tara:strand:+ start:944 stop:1207 length:264 start_codon:yes stop_codon:yes gene_type:complete
MIIQIDDIIDGTKIRVTHPDQCKEGSTQRSVAEEVLRHEATITMGKVIGHIVKLPWQVTASSMAQTRRRERFECERFNNQNNSVLQS